jgi:hypothetical protein
MTRDRVGDVPRKFVVTDLTSQLDDGRYRARVAVMGGIAGYGLSQRFVDLETFSNEADARQRAIAAAQAWIDAQQGRDLLGLPTGIFPLT